MQNHIQTGAVITVAAPADVSSGDGVLLGSLFGVAVTDALSGADVALAVEGVFTLPKTASQAWTLGVPVYWTGTACTTTASTNKMIGCAVVAVGSGAGETTGTVRLNGGVVTA